MKRKTTMGIIAALAFLFVPALTYAQGVASDLHSLQGMLNDLYNQMMPLCAGLIGVARAIAGFATLWYIGARVWKHLAAAEQVDIYPLLRPFAIGFCILVFPSVLTLMNGVLQPVVDATHGMVTNTNQAIETMLANQQTQSTAQPGISGLNTDPDKWYQYSHPDGTNGSNGTAPATNLSDQFSGWGWKNMVKKAIAELLNVLFEAAALCIDTIRTFKLIVLAILGPLCFGLGVFDGFQHTIKQWIARYVNVFMWLPVANIFGAIIARIQENMLLAQQNGTLGGNAFGNENTAYLIFLVIGIVGYFTVPSIANYIMNVGGHALFSRTSALASMAVSYVSGNLMQGFFNPSPPPQQTPQNNQGDANNGQPAARDKLSGSGKT